MLNATFLLFSALKVHAALQGTENAFTLGEDTFPIGILTDGRRLATPYGVEFRQDGAFTVIVLKDVKRFGKQIFRFSEDDLSTLDDCPLIRADAGEVFFDPAATRKRAKLESVSGQLFESPTRLTTENKNES